MQLLHSCNIMPLSILASRPEIPQELEKIIFHCIALIPAERFQTVTEIGSALITLQKTRLLSRIQNVINHGNEYLSNEEFLLSIKHFKQILSVTEKQRIDDLLQRAWNIGKNGDFEKAGVYFQEILKIDDTQKNTIKAMWKIIRLYVKGKKYIQIQEYATAIEILNQIFTIDPDNQDAKILIEDANKQWQSLTTAVLHSDSALSDQNILLPVNQISEQTDFFPMRLLKRLYKKQTLSCSSRIIGAKNRAELCNISEKEQLCLLTNSVELRRKIGHVLYKFIGSLSKDPNAWYFDKSDVYTEDANRLMVGIKHVNLSILQQKVTPPPTIASFFVSCQNLFIAHVGNYGIYQLRNGKLNTFSREDNRTLGLNQTIAVDIITVAPQQNDIYVCCSERLIPYISERKIQELLTQRTNEIHKIFYEIKSLANFESIIILEWFNNPSAQ
jgi:protein phosphatase